VLRGKYIDRAKLESVLDKGFGFCDVVLGWDSSDQLYDNTTISGWHTGYRDAPAVLDPSTARRIPYEEDTILVLGEFAGGYADACPRVLLRRVAARARAMGYVPKAALEYEFFLFEETPHSAREKGYRDLKPFTPGMFGYSFLRGSVHADLHREIIETMAAMDCELEMLHTETGPGVLEAAIRVDEIERAADKAALFKTIVKVLAERRGLMATFMAKWSDQYPGQSGHVHLSLADATSGENLFFDAEAPGQTSALMGSFVAGQVSLMPEVLPMVCSTTNAYRRLVPGMWAPIAANWGVDNRTTAVRVIPAGPEGTRTEYRIGPADANPYLALAAALGSGLWGIERSLDPGEPVVGNAYEDRGPKSHPLPTSLGQATRDFRASSACGELFGETFVDHFAATREWEDRESRKHVTDWELSRYFEII